MGSNITWSNIVPSDSLPRCFARMAGLSSFHNMSEYLAVVTVLENRGSGLFLFVIVVHWRPGNSESVTLALPFLNKSLQSCTLRRGNTLSHYWVRRHVCFNPFDTCPQKRTMALGSSLVKIEKGARSVCRFTAACLLRPRLCWEVSHVTHRD